MCITGQKGAGGDVWERTVEYLWGAVWIVQPVVEHSVFAWAGSPFVCAVAACAAGAAGAAVSVPSGSAAKPRSLHGV